jgi:hypothetical protein
MAITTWFLILLNDVYYDYFWVIFVNKTALESKDFYIRIFCNFANLLIVIYLFVLNKKMFKTNPKENQLKPMGGIGSRTASETEADIHQKK